MIGFPETDLDSLIDLLQSYKKWGCTHVGISLDVLSSPDSLKPIQVDVVCVNKDGLVVGEEAEDYDLQEKKPDEFWTVRISSS
jgi:hypothetical protein